MQSLNMDQNAPKEWKSDGFFFKYEGWNFNCGNYLFTADTK